MDSQPSGARSAILVVGATALGVVLTYAAMLGLFTLTDSIGGAVVFGPMIGGTVAGYASRMRFPVGRVAGFASGVVAAVLSGGFAVAWLFATIPTTGGAGLAVGVVVLLVLIGGVVGVVTASLGGLFGAALGHFVRSANDR